MLNASKQYKKVINKNFVNFKRSFRKKIRNMKSKQPCDYWRYV